MSTTRKFLRNMDKVTMSNLGRATKLQKVVSAVTAMGFVLQPVAAMANTITRTDGGKLDVNGNVTNVWAGKVINDKVAMSVFQDFKIDPNNIANMYFKEQAQGMEAGSLVNFVNTRIDINGTVNAIKGGKIGGNLFFLSKDGMAVGATGVINTGSLYVATPNANKITELQQSLQQGAIKDNLAENLVYSVPINKSGTITVMGKINAADDVHLRAPQIGIGKNVSGDAQYDAQPGGTNASITTGVANFADIVNIKDAQGNVTVDSGLRGEALQAEKTANGDIVLSAYNSYNDNYYGIKSAVSDIAGEKVNAELTVAKGAAVNAAGKAELTAQAVNNIDAEIIENNADLKRVSESRNKTDSLVGQIVDTKANINIDGEVTGKHVDIAANAVNRYVSSETGKLTSFTQKLHVANINLDAAYGKLNSEAKVNIGKDAVVKATQADTIRTDENGLPVTDSEGNAVIDKALNIHANSTIDLEVGANAGGIKLFTPSVTKLIPAVGVSYAEANNNAEVNIEGALASAGSADIAANADSTIYASSITKTGKQGNIVSAAVTVANSENHSKVTIGETAKMAGQDLGNGRGTATIGEDVSVKANSTNSVTTGASVVANDNTAVATAVNVTEHNSTADVDINASMKAGRNLAVNAANTLAENNVTADNGMGTTAAASKLSELIQDSQTMQSITGPAGLVSVLKERIAEGELTPGWLSDILGQKEGETPAPNAWDTVGDLFSAGASIGVANETNNSNISIGKGVQLEAGKDLSLKAASTVEDTYMNANGIGRNNNEDVDKNALVNAAVLYANLQNDATITVAGGNAGDGTNVQLKGENVDVQADSVFIYQRIDRMIRDVNELSNKVKKAYKNDDSEEAAKIKEKLAALEEAAAAFNEKANPENGEKPSIYELVLTDEFKDYLDAANEFKEAAEKDEDNMDGISVGNLSALSAAARFADVTRYTNFSAGTVNAGKDGEKEAKASIAGSATVTNIANNAKVLLGKNAVVEATAGKANLGAKSSQDDVVLTGKPSMNGGGSAAVGGTVGIGFADANSLVVVAEGAKITAGDINLKAENSIDHTSISIGAGKGGSVGVNGMVSYMSGDSNSIVSVDDEAVLIARKNSDATTGKINLEAINDTDVTTVAGAVSQGDSGAVGASIAVSNFDRYNYAAIADNDYGTKNVKQELANALAKTSDEKIKYILKLLRQKTGLSEAAQSDFFGSQANDAANAGSITASGVDVKARTTGEILNVTIAGGLSTGGDSDEESTFSKILEMLGDVKTGLEGKIKALDSGLAEKIQSFLEKADKAKEVLPEQEDDKKDVTKETEKPASFTLTGAGSASVNLLDGDTAAIIDGAKINIVKDEAKTSGNVNVSASDSSMVTAASGAAGLSLKNYGKKQNGDTTNVGVAGAVAVNDVSTGTLAVIRGSKIDNADAIINNAEKSGAVVAAGVGLAVSTNAAGNGATNVAASVNASVNLADNKVYALMQDNKVNETAQNAATSITNSAFDNDIQITGGLSASLSKGGSKGVAGGATVAYGTLENDIQSAMLGGTYNKITNADVTATTNMTQVGVAANASASMGADTSYAMSGNAAYNKLTNDVNASVEGVTLTGESLTVAAYDTAETTNEHTALLKARGFDADGSEYAEAAAAAANEEEDQDGNKLTNIDTTRKGNVIVTGAVSAGITTGSDGGSAGASISISDIDNDYNASIKGSTITTKGAGSGEDLRGTNVTAKSNTMLIGVAAGVAGTNGNFGVGGSASWENLDNDVTASIENSTIAGPKTDVNAISKAMAVNVAGQIGVSTGSNSKVGAGMAVAYNSLNNTTGAYVKGSTIYNPAASGAALNVNAANEGSVYSVGAAVGAGTSTATLNGAVVVNQGKNDVEAIVEDGTYQDENGETKTKRSALSNMNSVNVTSTDSSKQLAVVGAVSAGVGGKSKAAVGGTVVVNDIASQSNKAAIRNTDINTTDNGKIGVKALDNSALKTISIDMAMTTGNAAFSGAGAASLIDKETGAELVGTNVDQKANAAGNSDVEVKAASDSSITTVGVVLAGGKNAAGGLGISVNEIGADTTATIDGGNYKVKNLTAEAKSKAAINAIGIAAGVAKNAGLAGNVGVNIIDNDTKTTIKNATIAAKGTIAALANSQDRLSNIAGTAGVAAGGQVGLGMGVAYNEIKGETASVVSDSSLTAEGAEGAGVDVIERNKDNANATTAKYKGIVVAADATHDLQNIAISAGAAISADVGVGVAGTVTVNRILGATNAEINSTDLNKNLKDLSKADVLVNAADVTTSESHVGSLAVGVGADGGAGVGMASDTSVVSRNVTAQIDGGETQKTANGHNVAVNALNKAQMTTNADGVAIAGGAYGAAAGAGTVSVAKLDAATTARVNNIAGTNYGLAVNAEHKNAINQISAAAAVAAAAVSGAAGAGIGVVNDDSNTVAELSKSNITAKKDNGEATNGNITVKAANETDVTTTVVGVAASGVAAGLNVAVNNLNNKVTASVHDNTLLDAANKFAATANNKLAADFRSAAAAGGAGALAVGVGVNTIDTGVLTEVKDSAIKAGSIDVNAKETMDIKQKIAGASAGALGVNANVSVTSIGAALADSYGDNDSGDSKAKFTTSDILQKANDAVADQDNISKSDKNAAGSTFGKYNVTAKSGASASKGSSSAEGVQVKVSNANLTAAGNANIEAERHVDANVTSATATVAATGASVSVAALDVERKTGVTVDKSSITAGDALNVTSKQSGTAEVDAYQASAAGASVGVVYSGINLKGANAVNIMGSTLNAGNNLAVKTSDMSTGKLKTIGLAAAIAGTANVFVADAKNNSTSTITIDSKDEQNSALTSTNADVTVEAKHGDGTKPTLEAEMKTVSVAGIASGLGFNTAVTDNSSTAISVGNNQSFAAGKDINIKAENNSVNIVKSSAITGALGVAAGATGAEAKGTAASSLTVGSGNTFTAETVNLGAKANVKNVAEIHSIGAGIGAITVNWAKASGKTDVAVNIGDNTYNAKEANIKGESVINQKASADGITAGLVTSGSNMAKADAEEKINVVVGTDNGTNTATGDVNITADGKIIHDVSSNGDGGALFDASPVAARTESNVDSTTKVKVRGNWTADDMSIAAVHDNNNITLDTNALKAAVVGLSGVEAKSDITNNTSVDLANAKLVAAGDVALKAQNDINYSNTMKAGGYGVASGNALDSRDTFNLNSKVKLANSNITSKGKIDISALTGDGVNQTDSSNRPNAAINKSVTLESAGAVAGTWAVSRDNYNVNNNILVDENSSVTTAGNSNYTSNNDINMVATDMVGFTDVATANTQGGLVGAASAKLKADFTRNNNITVNGKLDSNYDVKLNAGGNSIMNVTLKSNAYNKTAAPIVANPSLNYTMTQNNNVVIGERADGAESIKTVRNINLIGDSGDTTIALQSESYKWTQGGTTSNASLASTADGTQSKDDHLNNGVTVNGKLLAGKNTKLEITIDDGDDIGNLNDSLNSIVEKSVSGHQKAYEEAEAAYDKYAEENGLTDKRDAYNAAQAEYDEASSTANALNKNMENGAAKLKEAADAAKATLDTAAKEWWKDNAVTDADGNTSVSITLTTETGTETKTFKSLEEFLAQDDAAVKEQYIAAAKAKENAGATTDPSAGGTTGGTTTTPDAGSSDSGSGATDAGNAATGNNLAGANSAANTVDLSSTETGSTGEIGSTEAGGTTGEGGSTETGSTGEGGEAQTPTLEGQADAFVGKLTAYKTAQEKYENASKALGSSAELAGGVTLNSETGKYEVNSDIQETLNTTKAAYEEIANSEECKNLLANLTKAEDEYTKALDNQDDIVTAVNDYIKESKDKDFVHIKASDWFKEQNDGSVMNSLEFQNYAQGLSNRLTELNNLIQEYGETAAAKSFSAEKARLQNELIALGLGYYETVQRSDGTTAQGNFVYDGSASTVPTVDLKNILVTGGNINIKGGSLSGKGEMTAVGGPEVKITNNSQYYLHVNDITIDGDGGNVKFNDAAIKSGNGLTVNDSPGKLIGEKDASGKVTSSNNAQVTIEAKAKKANPDSIFTPDVGIFGTIYNPYGNVTIKNDNNSIYLAAEIKDGAHQQKGGSIKAREITLTSGGNITQGYNEGIENIGGSPHYAVDNEIVLKIQKALVDKLKDKTASKQYRTAFKSKYKLAEFLRKYVDTSLSYDKSLAIADQLTDSGSKEKAGMYASGAIYINAAAVNINGTVQSGYDTYKVDVNQSRLAELANKDHTGITDFKTDDWLVTTGTAGAVYDSKLGKYVYNVSAWYNPETGEIITEDIDQSGGGSIHIMGAIASTGGGQLIALDGSANVTINNDGNTKLTVGSINTDSVKGKITVVDTNFDENNQGYRTTVYTRDGMKNGTAKYDPKSGQMYIWTSGETSQVITSYKAEYNSSWFGLKKEESEEKLQKDKVATATVSLNGQQTTQGDVINDNELSGGYLNFRDGDSQFSWGLAPDDGASTRDTEGNVYQISFERSAKIKQGKDASDNLLYWTTDESGNEVLTTEAVNDNGESNNPYYLTDANGNYIYDTTISDKVVKKKKKLFGIWGSKITTTWKETKGMLTSYEFGLKADNPIDIKFIGNKDGGNVGITSGGDIKLAGDIRAKDVSITSKTGSIKADSFGDSLEQKTIFSDNLKLKAGQNIEVVQQGVDKGLNLNAEAGTSKDNYIKINTLAGLKTGDVYLENVKAGGDITLNIDGRALRGARDNYDANITEANIVSGGNLSLSASKGIGEAGKE